MGRHLRSIAAALHGAPAPASGPRRVDEQQRTPRSLAPLESRTARPAEDVDGVLRDRGQEASHAPVAHPRPGRIGQQARDQARLRGQPVQHFAVALRDRPVIDERVGDGPDRRLEPDRYLEVIVGRLQLGHTHDLRSPALEIGRPPKRLEVGQWPIIRTRPRHREGHGEAPCLEREDLPVGVMKLEGADLHHSVTISSGYEMDERSRTTVWLYRCNSPWTTTASSAPWVTAPGVTSCAARSTGKRAWPSSPTTTR